MKEGVEVKVPNVAIVFAGGSGVRMGASRPKQFLELDGKPVLAHTLGIFQDHPLVDAIVLAADPAHFGECRAIAADYGVSKPLHLAPGGETAQDSIRSALETAARLYPPETVVIVHDGVRPYVLPEVVTANIESVLECGTAVTYTPCFETVVLSRDGRAIDAMPYRRESYTVQAPQSFRLGALLDAHARIRARPQGYADMIDQATIFWTLGIPLRLVPGNRGNVKITTPEDIIALGALLKARRAASGGKEAAK